MFKEFLNDENVEKLTTVGGELFQTFIAERMQRTVNVNAFQKFAKRAEIYYANRRRKQLISALAVDSQSHA